MELAGAPRLRIALYSHDAMGLGHLRRNLAIARALVESPLRASVLILSGVREAGTVRLPAHTDCLALPALSKDSDGCYRSRALALPLSDLIRLRSQAIRGALEAFAPQVLVADRNPLGLCEELAPALRSLAMRGGTRCILGLRDVLDEPAVVEREWRTTRTADAVRAFFDAVWVYGDPAVYDPLRDVPAARSISDLVQFTGYLGTRAPLPDAAGERAQRARLGIADGRLLLCVLGGGQDGLPIAWAFANTQLPEDGVGVIVTGPFMPEAARRRLIAFARSRPRLHVFEFVQDIETLVHGAERIVAMGGYNTVCEALAARKPVLLVPRTTPRREQWLRAERLRELGMVDVIARQDLTPSGLGHWLTAPRRAPDVRSLSLDGLSRLPALLSAVLGTDSEVARRSTIPATRKAIA
jgi:predicted glycosyltransferase